MSNIISKAEKRKKKKEEEHLAAQVFAIKQLIVKQAFSTMKVLVTFMFPELRRETGIDYTTASWLVDELVKKIPEDEEMFTALSGTVSSEGLDNGGKVEISHDKLAEFIELCKSKITVQYCSELLATYDKTRVSLETAIGASKIMNERSGQEFEIVSNGSVDLPEELQN